MDYPVRIILRKSHALGERGEVVESDFKTVLIDSKELAKAMHSMIGSNYSVIGAEADGEVMKKAYWSGHNFEGAFLDESLTLDLNEPNSLTEENVGRLIGSVEDDRNWQIRIRYNGIVYMSDVVGNAEIDNVHYRTETFGAGNGYVGKKAAEDKEWVKQVYKELSDNWPKTRFGYPLENA